MKQLLIIIAAMLLSASAFAQDGRSLYHKYSDEDGVKAVYISPAMFKLIGKLPSFEIGDDGEKIDLTPIIKSLKGFYLLNSTDRSIVEKIGADAKKVLSSGDYDVMLEAKEDGETVRIYTEGDDDIIHSFIMTAGTKSEITFISMDGLISRKDFEKALGTLAY